MVQEITQEQGSDDGGSDKEESGRRSQILVYNLGSDSIPEHTVQIKEICNYPVCD